MHARSIHPAINAGRFIGIAILTAIFVIYILTGPATAQDGTVTVPLGQWLNDWIIPVLAFLILLGITVALAFVLPKLPPWAQAAVELIGRDRLIALAADALNMGVQQVKGATKNAVLEVNIGNAVIAAAAQQFIDTQPQAIIDKLGGVEGVKRWILTQAEDHGVILDPGTTAKQVLNSLEVKGVRP